jgi:hypothetical protein
VEHLGRDGQGWPRSSTGMADGGLDGQASTWADDDRPAPTPAHRPKHRTELAAKRHHDHGWVVAKSGRWWHLELMERLLQHWRPRAHGAIGLLPCAEGIAPLGLHRGQRRRSPSDDGRETRWQEAPRRPMTTSTSKSESSQRAGRGRPRAWHAWSRVFCNRGERVCIFNSSLSPVAKLQRPLLDLLEHKYDKPVFRGPFSFASLRLSLR